MLRIKKYLDIRFKKHNNKWDTVGIIGGDEGTGKSNLGLHMIDYWQTLRNGKSVPEDVKHMCLEGLSFAQDLADAQENEITAFDEAGELDSRRAMSNFNTMISRAYGVIRADRIFTLMILPNLWDLEPRFRNRRTKFYMHVYRRGRVAVWLKDKMRRMIALNEGRIIKNPFIVKPDFYDTFPIYKGSMVDKYEIMKKKKTTNTRKKLPELLLGKKVEKKKLDERDIENRLLKRMGLSQAKRGEILGIKQPSIWSRDKKLKEIENSS